MKKLLSTSAALLIALLCIFTAPVNVFAETIDHAESEYIIDDALIMTDYQCQMLYGKATQIKADYGFDIVIVTVNNTGDMSPKQYAEECYDNNAYGPDWLLFLLSMETRDYWVTTAGRGRAVFDDRLDSMADTILNDLSGGNYYTAFDTYLSLVEAYLELENNSDKNDDAKYVIDNAGLLTETDKAALNKQISSIRSRYGFDMVILTAESLNGKSPKQYAEDYYNDNSYGPDGLLFLLSMDTRDYWAATSGRGKTVFPSDTLDSMANEILSDLSGGHYYSAFDSYLDEVDTRLDAANSNKGTAPLSMHQAVIFIIIVLVLAFIIALCIVNGMKKRMNTKNDKTDARQYVQNGMIDMHTQKDIFLYSNVTRVLRQTDSNSRGGGSSHGGSGGSFSSGGGSSHGGSGGKF